jgi:hypothetical protein
MANIKKNTRANTAAIARRIFRYFTGAAPVLKG